MKGDGKLNLNDTIEKCQLGDTEAFRELFTYIEPKAFGTAYLISGKRGLSEDIVQETFVSCMEQIKSLKCPAAFNVWFYRILTRIGWRMVKQYSKFLPKEEIAQNAFRNDFEEQVQKSMTYSKLRTSVNELSVNLKTVIILYYFNEMSIKEIAKITHTLETTVKTRLFYARTLLHKKLEDQVTDFSKGENYNHI
jgi:RNA polymerase sigma-70 factor (ECF subfamily)